MLGDRPPHGVSPVRKSVSYCDRYQALAELRGLDPESPDTYTTPAPSQLDPSPQSRMTHRRRSRLLHVPINIESPPSHASTPPGRRSIVAAPETAASPQQDAVAGLHNAGQVYRLAKELKGSGLGHRELDQLIVMKYRQELAAELDPSGSSLRSRSMVNLDTGLDEGSLTVPAPRTPGGAAAHNKYQMRRSVAAPSGARPIGGGDIDTDDATAGTASADDSLSLRNEGMTTLMDGARVSTHSEDERGLLGIKEEQSEAAASASPPGSPATRDASQPDAGPGTSEGGTIQTLHPATKSALAQSRHSYIAGMHARPRSGSNWRERKAGMTRYVPKKEKPVVNLDEHLMKASYCVKDAQCGRRSPNTMTPFHVRIYRLHYSRLSFPLLLICCLVIMGLVFFEEPRRGLSRPVEAVNPFVLWMVEAACVVFFLYDISLKALLQGRRFFGGIWNMVSLSIILAIAIDVLLDLFLSLPRFSRPLRPLVLIMRVRQLRSATRATLRTLPKLQSLLFMISIVIITYGLIGVHVFGGLYKDGPYSINGNFDSLGPAALTLFVLLTSENYPGVMGPAYKESSWAWIYFVSFYVLMYLMLSIVLAVIFDAYKEQKRALAVVERVRERRCLARAFYYLDAEKQGFIDWDRFLALVNIILPNADVEEVQLLFRAIDKDGNKVLDVLEFFELCDVLMLRFSVTQHDETVFTRRKCIFGLSMIHQQDLLRVVSNVHFLQVIAVLAVLSVIPLCLYTHEIESRSAELLFAVNFGFIVLFWIEVTLKMFAGFSHFWSSGWNRYDLLLIFGSTVFHIVRWSVTGDARRYLAALLSLQILRLFSLFTPWRKLVTMLISIMSGMFDLAALLLVTFYMFAVIGMEVFAERIPNPPVFTTNFDTFGQALLTLFQVFTTSNWHEVMLNAMQATTGWAVFYFLTFFVFVVIFILNLVIAMVIETRAIYRELHKEAEDHIILDLPEVSEGQDNIRKVVTAWRGKLDWNREMFKEGDDVGDHELQAMQEAVGSNVDLVELRKRKEAEAEEKYYSNNSDPPAIGRVGRANSTRGGRSRAGTAVHSLSARTESFRGLASLAANRKQTADSSSLPPPTGAKGRPPTAPAPTSAGSTDNNTNGTADGDGPKSDDSEVRPASADTAARPRGTTAQSDALDPEDVDARVIGEGDLNAAFL